MPNFLTEHAQTLTVISGSIGAAIGGCFLYLKQKGNPTSSSPATNDNIKGELLNVSAKIDASMRRVEQMNTERAADMESVKRDVISIKTILEGMR